MRSAMITVIVPVYNAEKHLKRCVDSLLLQSITNIEIILVDDGACDRSPVICDEYARRDTRVVTIHKKNEGQGLARNDGIRAASGKYICFLDSDDYYEPITCERLVNVMESTQAGICSYGYQMDDKDGNLVKRPLIREREYVGEEVRDSFLLHYFGDSLSDDDLRGVSSCMSVFRRDIILDNDVNFPSERVVASEDTAFCLEYCKYVDKAVTISDSLYHYCQNEGSFSQDYREDRLRLMRAHIKLLQDFSEQYGNHDLVKDRIAMTAWINLIASFKQLYRHFGRQEAIAKYREFAEDAVIAEGLKGLLVNTLPTQQKLLFRTVKMRMYGLTYLLVGIRASKRL